MTAFIARGVENWAETAGEVRGMPLASRTRHAIPIRLNQSILFATFATRHHEDEEEKVSLAQQIVDGLDHNFDSVMMFSEPHAMLFLNRLAKDGVS